MGGTKRRQSFGACALGVALAMLAGSAAGCRVAESDVKRWETTQRGPYKLIAVVTHDKYSWELRTEAAIALVRMPPRGGVRQGISLLVDKYKDEDGITREGALNQLPEDARRQIVDLMAPELIKQLEPPPPARTPEGRMPADPTIPFKDATFAMLTHEPPLVSTDKTRQDLKAALTKWAQTGFEDRVENGAQQFGLEQMMRFLGPESVRTLPGIINENATRLDRIASLINDVGDDATKLKASEALVELAKKYNTKEWLEAQTRIVKEHNAKNNTKADENQVAAQVDKIQERRLTEEVFPAMKKVGGRPAIDYLFGYAAANNPAERRKLALAALEGRVDKNNPADLDRLFAIVRNEDIPDAVRDVAFHRMGEFPKEQIVPKLFTLFDPKKWKTRWVAAETILKTMTTRQVPELMARLPKTPATKMGMTEPLSYGGAIRKMEPGAGEPKPRDVIAPYLTSRELGAKLTALGYFWEGKKADHGVVQPFAEDSTPLPKCEKEDECSWSCDVPKAPGSKETEPKELKTVGEFVKHCLIPSMDKN
ncbi:MAG: hypothetical protein KF819_04225 [Labilithrix sp.]|nr:hypothetical protein [Labilithrix sp.]